MLSLLPLPITWLALYGLGRVLNGASIDCRRYVVAGASVLVLFAAAGPTTAAFYVSVGLGVLVAGNILLCIKDTHIRRIVFIAEIVFLVVMIFAYLKWRIYFQKYFVYLPSLSYLGFRGIAYLVSRWKRERIDLSAGLLQMLFFPMLLMGPISRVENFEKEYRDYRQVVNRLMQGLSMLIGGYLCGRYVIDDLGDAIDLHWLWYWVGALANSFEFYFTFAGYSHLIIGLGILVGFKLPENFNNPYLATSIGDFWRRWHMSLSYWIRDYVYFPLGGNRRGIAHKCLNLMLSMTLVGIWHGLESHYLIWGVFHGALLSVESIADHFQIGIPRFARSQLLQVATTFSLVTFGWLLFKYSLPEFLLYLERMVPS